MCFLRLLRYFYGGAKIYGEVYLTTVEPRARVRLTAKSGERKNETSEVEILGAKDMGVLQEGDRRM